MLIKLKNKSGISPVALNSGPDVPADGTLATVMGFGATKYHGSLSLNLLKVDVPIVNQTVCETSYNRTLPLEKYLCAGEGGHDSCQGDSGSPLIQNGIVVGLVSFGRECALPNFPGVYTRISNLTDWIRQGICDLSDDPFSDCTFTPGFDRGSLGGASTSTSCPPEYACSSWFGSAGREIHFGFFGLFCMDFCIPGKAAFWISSKLAKCGRCG
jgi:Trypsin